MALKYIFIAISFYLFIAILCAKILCVNWALDKVEKLITLRSKQITHYVGAQPMSSPPKAITVMSCE